MNFSKIAVHENNRICGEISERIPEQLRMDGRSFLESAAEFLKETGRNMDYPDTGMRVLPEKQVITKRVCMAGMDPKHLMLNLPYEFYDYLEHSVEEWVYDYSLDSIPDGTGQDERIFLAAGALSGLWSGTRNRSVWLVRGNCLPWLRRPVPFPI